MIWIAGSSPAMTLEIDVRLCFSAWFLDHREEEADEESDHAGRPASGRTRKYNGKKKTKYGMGSTPSSRCTSRVRWG